MRLRRVGFHHPGCRALVAKADPSRFDDLFEVFGKIRLRAMFGGEGIYRDDVMFGLVFDERIYLKVDDTTRAAFLAEGCKPFVFNMKGVDKVTSKYYALPDRLYDDPEELADWARGALKAAMAKPKKR